jgi:hypothetical protein
VKAAIIALALALALSSCGGRRGRAAQNPWLEPPMERRAIVPADEGDGDEPSASGDDEEDDSGSRFESTPEEAPDDPPRPGRPTDDPPDPSFTDSDGDGDEESGNGHTFFE